MIKTIYFDMDGVLTNFDRRYYELFGILPGSMRDRKDFRANWKAFVDGRNFATLDLWPEAQKLVDTMAALDGFYNIEILSSSGGSDFHDVVASQKIEWLRKRGLPYKANIVAGRKLKAGFASPETVLIDDTYDVIQSFIAAGGHAIHHKDTHNTLMMLGTILQEEALNGSGKQG